MENATSRKKWDVVAICTVNLYLGPIEAETRQEAEEKALDIKLTADLVASQFEPVEYEAMEVQCHCG